MKTILKMILFFIFINSLYAESKFLYPIYNVELDKISVETLKIVMVDKKELVIKYHFMPKEDKKTPLKKYKYIFNLNNLLLIHAKTDKEYLYNLLGRISINEDNKLKYEPLENNEKNINYEMIEKKQLELKKNIEYVNQNKLTLEEIKKALDVDLINEDLGEKLYSNKENMLSVEKATKNIINCRFCQQIVNIQDFKNMYECEIFYKNDKIFSHCSCHF